jgi:hypothetical protein
VYTGKPIKEASKQVKEVDQPDSSR